MNTHRKIQNLGLVLFAVISFVLFAKAGGDKEWRPITPGDLAMKEPMVEKDADAEAIFWEIRLDDKKSDQLAYEHYVRVKIFTERGRESFAKFDIPFSKGRKVKDVAARVIKPDGTITELNKADVFEREIAKADGIKIQAVSFAVTGIDVGVILEYRYREEIKNDSASGERLIFQRDIPVQRLSYYVRPYEGSFLKSEMYNMPRDASFDKDKDGFSVMTVTNVAAFKEEPRMPPINYIRSWVLIYYDSFGTNTKWANLARAYSLEFKDIIKQNGDVKKMSAEIIAGATTSDEKLRKIYEFCQKEIKNIVFDNSMTADQKNKINNKNPGDTLKRRMGDSGDIERLFAALATAAGFEARIVLSGNRNEFFFNPNQNEHSSFVHACCVAAKVDGKWKYVNPGTPFLAYGELVWYEEDTNAVLIGDGNYVLGQTPFTDYPKSLAKRTGKFKLLEDGTLEGDVTIEFTGQQAIGRRREGFDDAASKREDDFKEEIKDQISSAEVSGLTLQNFDEKGKPLVYSYKVRVPNYAQKTGKRLFLQPGFFEYGVKPIFSSATRTHGIFFHYPWSEEDNIEITLPANYALESADAPAIVADPGKTGSLTIKMNIDNAKNILTYKRDFYFGKDDNTFFPNTAYSPLKNLFDSFQKADSHTMTLKQK